jgi:2-desacetyl-2-hydroxyethyl bacteriochlorophyllide A dehydrogenase
VRYFIAMLVVQFSAPCQVEVVEVPPEPLPPGHLRVRTRYSGISAGTELTAYRGTNPLLTRAFDPSTRLFEPAAGASSYPVAGWGYSETGVVVESTAVDVPGAPAIGDLVWGIWGHRSEAVLPAVRLVGHSLAPGADLLAASFTRVGAVALGAVLAAEPHLGELVAIFGQGVIGLLATRLAVLSGARVVAVDGLAPRRKVACSFGASSALSPSDGPASRIRDLTGGRGADVAIELSGAYPALHEAIRSVTVAGRVVAAGFYQGDGVGLRLGEEFHHNRVQLLCSQIGGVPPVLAGRWDQDRLNRTFLDLALSGAVDTAALVSHVVPVSDAARAYELLDERPADALQVVLDFGDGDS